MKPFGLPKYDNLQVSLLECIVNQLPIQEGPRIFIPNRSSKFLDLIWIKMGSFTRIQIGMPHPDPEGYIAALKEEEKKFHVLKS